MLLKNMENTLIEKLVRKNCEKEKTKIDAQIRKSDLEIDDIKKKNNNEEEKQKIENENEIEFKKKELDQKKKMKEIEQKSKIDKDNYELNILKNKNETEFQEYESNKYLEQQEKKIENEKAKELLKNEFSFQERIMMNQMDAQKDEMLLQMLAAQMMFNNQMNIANHN
jgi:hypothetical protein